jgi:hypothetical protein
VIVAARSKFVVDANDRDRDVCATSIVEFERATKAVAFEKSSSNVSVRCHVVGSMVRARRAQAGLC